MASFPYDDIGGESQQHQLHEQQGEVIGNGSSSNAPTNSSLNDIISSLRQELEAKEDEIFDVQATLATVQAETTHHISQVEKTSQTQVSSLEQQIRRYESEANLAKREISLMQRRIAALTQERDKALQQKNQQNDQANTKDSFQQASRSKRAPQHPSRQQHSEDDPMDVENDEPSAVVSPAAIGTANRTNYDNPLHQRHYPQDRPSPFSSDPRFPTATTNNHHYSPTSSQAGHTLIQRLILIFGEKCNPQSKDPSSSHDTVLLHARILQSLTLLLTSSSTTSRARIHYGFSERDVVQHLLHDLLLHKDTGPQSTAVTLEWLYHALVWSPGAAQWMFFTVMTTGDGDPEKSSWQEHQAAQNRPRTALRFSSTKTKGNSNNKQSSKLSSLYNEWKRQRNSEWTLEGETGAGGSSLTQTAIDRIVQVALLQTWPRNEYAENTSCILRCSILALSILHMVLRVCPRTMPNSTAAMGKPGQAGTMSKALLSSIGFGPTTGNDDTSSSCNRLLFIFQRLINLQIQNQIQSTLPPSASTRGPLRWNQRGARLDDGRHNEATPEFRVENVIADTFLHEREGNEEIAMEWMTILFQLMRQIWSVTDTSELRYHVWLAIPRARFVLANLLDWIQIVLIPQHQLQGHLFPREAVRFIGMILCEETISGLFTLPLIQMGVVTVTEPPTTESNFAYSAVGVLVKTLSAIVQLQYRDKEKAKNASIQLSSSGFDRETVRRLNPLRDDIVRFFDMLLRITQSRNRKQQLKGSKPQNDSMDDLGTFADQTEERQDLYISAAALMLSFPDEDEPHALKMHGVRKVVKSMLQKQLEELQFLEEERCN